MKSPLIAWGMLALALAAWGGFVYFTWMLDAERTAYADAVILAEEEALRGEAAQRVRSTIQGSEAERASLESLMSTSILQAVETIEEAGRQAGATNVTIGEATPLSTSPKGIAQVSVVVSAEGTFAALMRSVLVYEALPIPSTIEQFEISKVDKQWRLTARLRVTYAMPAPQPAQPAATPTP